MTKPIHILLIEDEAWLAEQFQRTLGAAGFAVRTVSNGQVAMELIDDEVPDVIVLDVLLTGGTGITLLHELQSYTDTAAIPIVLCTNMAADIHLDTVAPYGVQRILDKTTMQLEDIVTAVKSVTL